MLTAICAELAEPRSAAGTVASSVEVFTKVVASGVLFQVTTEAATKGAGAGFPVTLRVMAPLPAMTLVGEMEASVGEGSLMVNVTAAEVPPPFETEICAVPAAASRFAGTIAFNCSAET